MTTDTASNTDTAFDFTVSERRQIVFVIQRHSDTKNIGILFKEAQGRGGVGGRGGGGLQKKKRQEEGNNK